MKRKTKVTMNDIARTAGVSQATVSLVLNQSRNIKLSDDTRQRVISVATELGYDRLPAIHAPRNQEEIALLVSSLQSFDPFIDAISQAREAAWRNEALLTVYDYGDDVELALNIIRQLEKRNCVGIILASPVTTLVDMTAFQDCSRIPLVLLNQRDPGSPLLPSFIPDDYANAFQVTKHLIACGAKRIAHITGESWMEASRQRLAGYQAALQQAEALRIFHRIAADGQMLRIVQRTPDPFIVTGMNRKTVGVMQFRAIVGRRRRLVWPEQEHAGQWRNAQFTHFIAQVNFGLNVNHGVAARHNYETVCPGRTRRIQQRIDNQTLIGGFWTFNPVFTEAREFFT